eukprot:GHRR01006475.1.p1 GENE.GHRR01006475.1~~GHRR01006475.1.p1  ORF type:complete len:250 (+),score=97.76 GHRR01006475.1:677-1426(+)
MDELFDRAFNKAHGTVHAVTGKATAAHDKQAAIASKEDALRTLTTPMTPKDAVERIHLAFKDGDYFRLLQLPRPQLNELGKAVWPVSSSEVSKAYRKLSILVHPDKNPGPDARQAFEQLKQAYNELRDSDKLAACLRFAEPGLQRVADRAAASASMAERMEMNAAVEERKAQLKRMEARSFQQQIQEQVKRRQAEAALKKQRLESSRYQRQHDREKEQVDGNKGSDIDDNDDNYANKQVKKKRKKPNFM